VLRAGAESAALLAGLIALAIACTAIFGWAYHAAEGLASLTFTGPAPPAEVKVLRVEPAPEVGGHDVADGRDAGELLAREREGKAAAERVSKGTRTALVAAERAAAEARRELLAEQGARQATEQAIGAVRDELARERTAREAAELATKQALERKPKAWRLKKVETPWTW
jgi:hypothetical protein